jgi:hypothetical protein
MHEMLVYLSWKSTCFASTGIHSKYSISCFRFYCFQQTGEPASRSRLTPKASTSVRNARSVHGSAPASVNFAVKCTGLLILPARFVHTVFHVFCLH